MKIIVVGSGIIGLTTALTLLRDGHQVTIWASAFPPNTTSDVAPGQWYPHFVHSEEVTNVKEWGSITYEHFRSDERAPERGVFWKREVLQASPRILTDQDMPSWRSVVDHFRRARIDELPTGYVDGYCFDAPLVNMSIYLPHLMREVRELGGATKLTRVESISSISSSAQIVVNCSGLGARELARDPNVCAVRGQVVHIPNRGFSRVISANHGPHGLVYIVPHGNEIILGGTSTVGDERFTIDEGETASIIERCRSFMPELGVITPEDVIRVECGLRPVRINGVRVEHERLLLDQHVIHNYGHSGAGISLSWGCASEVAAIVRDLC